MSEISFTEAESKALKKAIRQSFLKAGQHKDKATADVLNSCFIKLFGIDLFEDVKSFLSCFKHNPTSSPSQPQPSSTA